MASCQKHSFLPHPYTFPYFPAAQTRYSPKHHRCVVLPQEAVGSVDGGHVGPLLGEKLLHLMHDQRGRQARRQSDR